MSKEARIVRLEDLGLIDEGIVTTVSSKVIGGASDSANHDSAENETGSGQESGGMWRFKYVGLDDESAPSDEETILAMTQDDCNSSISYSIDIYREDPNDRHSVVDVEEAVLTRTQSRVPEPPISNRSAGGLSQNGSQNAGSRTSSKAQRRCTGIILTLFLGTVLVVIGLGLVLYFLYLEDDTVPVPSPSTGNGASFPAPTPEFEWSNPTIADSSTTVPVLAPGGRPAESPSTHSPATDLMQYLSTEYSVIFPEDPFASNNLAIDWLLDEAEEMNTSDMVLSERLVQRFALVALNLNWGAAGESPDAGNTTTTSFAEALSDECDWVGISCENDTVAELAWGNRQLTGRIPPEIALLTGLTYLDLSQNKLIGSLPDELYQLTALEELFLYDNQLTGTLSDRIGDMTSLERLHLSHNQLSGSLPLTMRSPIEFIRPYGEYDSSSGNHVHYCFSPILILCLLGLMTKTVYINLKSNKFSGILPTGLRWRKLWYLDLGGNNFEGPLPEDIDNMPAIRHLHLDHNQFNGTIPDALPQIGNGRIETLSLDHNRLEGAFPDQWDITWHMCEYYVVPQKASLGI